MSFSALSCVELTSLDAMMTSAFSVETCGVVTEYSPDVDVHRICFYQFNITVNT